MYVMYLFITYVGLDFNSSMQLALNFYLTVTTQYVHQYHLYFYLLVSCSY